MNKEDLDRRRKFRDDFVYYAQRCLYIKDKVGKIVPLVLNAAQLYIHKRVEEQRKRIGKVRVIIVKGRQQGCSTYTEARFYWKVSNSYGANAFILTHHDDATSNLFDMAKRYHDHVPAPLKPSTGTANAKELKFDKLDSGYKVSTAGSKGTGRSATLQLFHGSEVAYWPFADTHLSGVMQAVADMPDTEVFLESTATGPSGVFYELAKDAMNGANEYELIFIPWYWQAEYRQPLPKGFDLTSEEEAYAEKYSCDMQQMAWRRKKIGELKGVHVFRHEYPATVEEAFSAEVPGALWTREIIDENRIEHKHLPPLKRIVVGVDPSGGDGPQNDEVGIVAAGQDFRDHYYILEDVSGKMLPARWGVRAVAAYDRLEADRILGEDNYGGAMVEHVIRSVDKQASYKSVKATRGKAVRAEPVSSLYDEGRVHHVGSFIALEDEMVTWVPGMPSPNRMDAMVWCITELARLDKKESRAVKAAVGPQYSPFAT